MKQNCGTEGDGAEPDSLPAGSVDAYKEACENRRHLETVLVTFFFASAMAAAGVFGILPENWADSSNSGATVPGAGQSAKSSFVDPMLVQVVVMGAASVVLSAIWAYLVRLFAGSVLSQIEWETNIIKTPQETWLVNTTRVGSGPASFWTMLRALMYGLPVLLSSSLVAVAIGWKHDSAVERGIAISVSVIVTASSVLLTKCVAARLTTKLINRLRTPMPGVAAAHDNVRRG